MSLELIIILGLATYRITRLIVTDEITRPIRERLATSRMGEVSFAYLIGCHWCTSVWIAAGITAAADLIVGVALPGIVWPAVAAIAALIAEHWDPE